MTTCEESINETRIIGRPICGKTFSGVEIDYKFPNDLPPTVSTKYSKNDVENALLDSMSNLNDVALLLSGGKDSRLLACLLKKLGKDVRCYTYISHDSKYQKNELKVAKKVANILGFTHDTIKIDWDGFYDRKLIPKIIKTTDGVPTFQTILTMAYARKEIKEKNIVTGDLMTEILDTSEFRSGNQREYLFSSEKLYFDKEEEEDVKIVNSLHNAYITNTLSENILFRHSSRFLRSQVYEKLGYNVHTPAMDHDVIVKTLSLPILERIDGRLVSRIIKKNNRDLYKLRTARSPLSLRFPLSYHIAYAKIFKRDVDNPIITGFCDDRIYESMIKNGKTKQELYRMDNRLWWYLK